jgi:uncharacterized membrane protein YccC
MRTRTIVLVAATAAIVLWLSGSPVPGWLAVLVVVAAVALGFVASVKQNRMERELVRSWWHALVNRF